MQTEINQVLSTLKVRLPYLYLFNLIRSGTICWTFALCACVCVVSTVGHA